MRRVRKQRVVGWTVSAALFHNILVATLDDDSHVLPFCLLPYCRMTVLRDNAEPGMLKHLLCLDVADQAS